MPFKFEKLDVWTLSLDYLDGVYGLSGRLPKEERYNLTEQIRRAATSVSLNIAEGSTGQTDAEQARFLGIALRSLIETVACPHIIRRRGYAEKSETAPIYQEAEKLTVKLQAMRRSIQPDAPWVREDAALYRVDDRPMTADDE